MRPASPMIKAEPLITRTTMVPEIKQEHYEPITTSVLVNDPEVTEVRPSTVFDDPKPVPKPKTVIGTKKMGIKTELPPLNADKSSNPFAVKTTDTEIPVETRVNSHIVDALHEISKTKEITAGKTKSVKRKAQTTLFGGMVKEGDVLFRCL